MTKPQRYFVFGLAAILLIVLPFAIANATPNTYDWEIQTSADDQRNITLRGPYSIARYRQFLPFVTR